jgi:hypothetical protein
MTTNLRNQEELLELHHSAQVLLVQIWRPDQLQALACLVLQASQGDRSRVLLQVLQKKMLTPRAGDQGLMDPELRFTQRLTRKMSGLPFRNLILFSITKNKSKL